MCDGLATEQNTEGGYENIRPILSRLCTEVHEILGHCRKPLCSVHCPPRIPRFPTSCFIRKIFSVKIDVKLQTRHKTSKYVVLGPRFLVGGDTTNFVYAFLNRTHFRFCWPISLSLVHWTRRVRREDKEDRVGVKPKSMPTTTSDGLMKWVNWSKSR